MKKPKRVNGKPTQKEIDNRRRSLYIRNLRGLYAMVKGYMSPVRASMILPLIDEELVITWKAKSETQKREDYRKAHNLPVEIDRS